MYETQRHLIIISTATCFISMFLYSRVGIAYDRNLDSWCQEPGLVRDDRLKTSVANYTLAGINVFSTQSIWFCSITVGCYDSQLFYWYVLDSLPRKLFWNWTLSMTVSWSRLNVVGFSMLFGMQLFFKLCDYKTTQCFQNEVPIIASQIMKTTNQTALDFRLQVLWAQPR